MAQTFPKFLELPAEIRLKIYFYVMVMRDPIHPKEVQPLGILRTSHLMYQEASEKTYYQHNTFILGHCVPEETKWLARIGDKRRQMIRKMEVRDAHRKRLGTKMFDLLSQCSKLSLTIETPVKPLAQYLYDGNLAHFYGVPKVTIEHLCKGRQTEGCTGHQTEDQTEGQTEGQTGGRTERRTERQQLLWKYWLEELEEVKFFLKSNCEPTCLFHVNKARLGPESAVHLRITHCCRQKHCCDDEWLNY